jgi:hypothetical protein
MELDCIYTYLGISDHIGALVILIEGNSGTLATRRTYISIYPSQLAKKMKLRTFLRPPFCEVAKGEYSKVELFGPKKYLYSPSNQPRSVYREAASAQVVCNQHVGHDCIHC